MSTGAVRRNDEQKSELELRRDRLHAHPAAKRYCLELTSEEPFPDDLMDVLRKHEDAGRVKATRFYPKPEAAP